MTDENLDTLRAAIQAFNCRDFDVALVPVADEATWAPFLARTETSLLRGKSQIRAAWERQSHVSNDTGYCAFHGAAERGNRAHMTTPSGQDAASEMNPCASCGTDNPQQARYCMSCGGELIPLCAACGTTSPAGARFCIECGSTLQVGGDSQARPGEGAHPEERRKATVLFADLSGYTAVSERLDPERVKSLVDRSLRRLGEEVERHGGTIDKFIGDNVMGVFGAPVAHEDDPERAVRTGLAMQAAMEEVNDRIAADVGAHFALRVGINSGEVLAGRVGDGYTVIGDAVNVAARLQGAAEPGTVIVGESTHRLTRGAVEYVELAPLELKGKSEPVSAWTAVRAVVRGRAARPSRMATTVVGREQEMTVLKSLYERVVRERRPHLVTVIGPAGVGKSRLLRELADRVGELERPPAVRLGSCPAYGAGLSYWALGEIVRATFDIADTDDAETAWRKLLHGIEALAHDADSEVPPQRLASMLARPLGIDATEAAGEDGDPEDPQQIRDSLFGAVRSVVEAASRRQPLILAVEDIHWADEGTLDLIEYLARWIGGPAMLMCLARDELLDRRPSWGGGRLNGTNITLDPLPAAQARALVAALLPASSAKEGSNGAQDLLIDRVAERSGGNPLFAEEMVNRVLEEGSSETGELPDTVHSVLAARLDSLPRAERRLLQHAAVVGPTFWEGSLQIVGRDEAIDLPGALLALQERDLIVSTASGLAGEREYAFKHVLIRDVAYSTLPKAVRARKHAEVADFVLEHTGEQRSEGAAAMVAEHLARAASLGAGGGLDPAELGVIETRAVEALESAGDAAAALYSNLEAIAHYESGLALRSVATAERARINEKRGDVALRVGQLDLAVDAWNECLDHHRGEEDLTRVGDLHRKVGAGLWQKGDRQGAIEHYQRGIDLLKDGPASIELVRLYEEAASLYVHTGDNMLAIYASEKALRLAERLGEAGAASRAHGIFGRVFGRLGDSERARDNLLRSVELARGTNPTEAVRALSALGHHFEISEADYDAAAGAYEEALGLAHEMGEVPSEVELHASLAQLAVVRGAWEEAERQATASMALAEREALAGKLCFPLAARGILLWHAGELEDAVELLERALEGAEQTGRSETAFGALFWLAACRRDRGEYADADQNLARALDLCERAGLVAQSVEATAARAVNLALWGKSDGASDAAGEAASLADRLRYPVGAAASLEARAVATEDSKERTRLLAEARVAWEGLGRPVDAARAERLVAELSAP